MQTKSAQPRGPNFLARAVARIGLSIRSKLLISFLGITCLLVGVALFGLNALQQANERTGLLIHDQQRIQYFNGIYGALAELNSLVLALHVPNDNRIWQDGGFFNGLTENIDDRVDTLKIFIGRGVRRFGKLGMPDEGNISALREDLGEIKKVAQNISQFGRNKESQRAAEFGLKKMFDPVRAMQRDTYTIVRQIEQEMSNRGKITATAYLTSRQNILAAALAAVGSALLLGFSISSSLLWPITRIRSALGQLAGGGFDQRIEVPNRDELGALAGHVNDTSARLGALYNEVEVQKEELAGWNAALEDKVADQMIEIERTSRLRRFLPAQVADLIVGSEDETEVLRSRRAEVTVLFADLRGFTSFANSAAPAEVMGALNAFHGACGPLIEAHGGTLERFLGDGVMVLFGAPVSVEDAAERAVALAREMQVAVRKALKPLVEQGYQIGCGIGIGTGPATVGQIGFDGRRDYSAIGPAPNLAARLCDFAKDGQILISHSTVWQIEVPTKPAGKFDLKGIGDAVAAFELA